MAIDYKVIGERIKKAILAKYMTQEDLAESLNISVPFLSRVETGKAQINLKRLSEICGVLGVSEGYILNGVSSKSASYLTSEFNSLLKSCPPEKVKLIYALAKVVVDN